MVLFTSHPTWLAAEEASFITGETLPIDGGLSIQSAAALLRPSLRLGWRQGRADVSDPDQDRGRKGRECLGVSVAAC